MSIESVAKALDVDRVKGTVKLVLIGICNHDGDNGAWPSIATLARYAVCSNRRVQQCIAELEAHGLITVVLNGGGLKDWREDRRPNRYVVHLDGVKPTAPRDDDGVKSGAARGETQRADGVKPTAPKPSINRPEEPSISLSPDGDTFEKWWSTFRTISERPGSKGDAHVAWQKLSKMDRGFATVAICRHAGYVADFPSRFVMPNGSTWLNKRRWLDEMPQEPPRQQTNNHSGIAALNRMREAGL